MGTLKKFSFKTETGEIVRIEWVDKMMSKGIVYVNDIFVLEGFIVFYPEAVINIDFLDYSKSISCLQKGYILIVISNKSFYQSEKCEEIL